MATYGYVRKNYPDDTATQLKRVMAYECKDIFVEEESLEIDAELKKLISKLEKGDTLVVDSISAFGKTLHGLNDIFETLSYKKIRLVSQSECLDTKKEKALYELVQMLFNVNKKCQSHQIKARIAMSKSLGNTLGRPTLDEETVIKIKRLHRDEKLSMRSIAYKCGVSVGSVHKYIQENQSLLNV